MNPVRYFDNSKMADFRGCPKKGYWKHIFTLEGAEDSGIVRKGADALNFGSCIHEGLAAYYTTGSESEGFRAFSKLHEELFGEDPPYQDKHSLEAGLVLLGEYFEMYVQEDPLYTVREVEIAGAFPLPGIDAIYQGKTDGIWQRGDDLMIVEHKTTSMGVSRETERLSYSQQVEGYVWLWKKLLPHYSISMVMGNALAVLKAGSRAKRFSRQYYHIPAMRVVDWEQETVKDIHDIQLTYLEFDRTGDVGCWGRHTDECFRYGRCPYMDLCQWGAHEEYLEEFIPNTWDPLK